VSKVLGAVMVVAALVLAIAPVFTDCQSDGKWLTTANGKQVSMKCHWTGIAEIAAAIPLAIGGLYALLGGRRKETTRLAAIVGVASGAVAILLPTFLIGTCGSATMTCNLLMRPILLSAGIVAIVASTALFFVARDQEMPVAPAAAA